MCTILKVAGTDLKLKFLLLCICFSFSMKVKAQYYEAKSVVYNTAIGAITSGVGAIINKKKEQTWHAAFIKGLMAGAGGGVLMYTGKKLNTLIANEKKLGYGWLSRSVFCMGTSIIENAAMNRNFWSVWHYDLGFIRLEYDAEVHHFQPKLKVSSFGATLFLAIQGKWDMATSLKSGTPTFRTREISYQPKLVASTVTTGFLLTDTLLSGTIYYDTYAHEMVHSFQFVEFSGVNHFFKPITSKWETKSPVFKNIHQWLYGDLNYELMLFNYFIVQGGSRQNYCNNFLENEAEALTVGRPACYN